MANPEHVDKLLESVEVWNVWRHENPAIAPALWGADLEETDLSAHAKINSHILLD